MRRLLAAMVFGAIGLCGCSLAPPYQPPQTAIPAAYKETGMWTQAAPQDSLPKGTWWSAYRDPTLDMLETQIESSNPTLADALARYDESRAYLAQAQSQLFPLVGANVQTSSNRQSDNRPLRGANQPDEYANNYIAASITYELDLWGRVRNLVAAGKAQEEASAADVANVRLSLQAQLADSYMLLRGMDGRADILDLAVSAYARALDVIRQRYAEGIASGLDLARAETQINDAKSQSASVAAQRALYEHAIASLTGTPASAFSIPSMAASVDVPNIPAGVPSALLQRRPDIAAAERRVVAANAAIGVARAAFYPTIALGGTVGFQNTGGADLLSAPNLLWSIGPAAVLTLFDAGARQAQVDIAVSRRDQAADSYRADVLQAFQDVEDNLALLNRMAEAAEAEDAAVEAASRTQTLSMQRYELGAVSYLDVVTAQTAELQAKLRALEIQTTRLQSSVRLIRALGGGWTTVDGYVALTPQSSTPNAEAREP